jgi:phosphoglycerate dehydrogenase-like enzyme
MQSKASSLIHRTFVRTLSLNQNRGEEPTAGVAAQPRGERMTRYPTLFLTERGQRHQAAVLQAAPFELEVVVLRQPNRELLISHLKDAVFLITERGGAVDREMIAAAPNLRLIVRLGSLVHDIDLVAARAAGVAVCAQSQRGAIMVAEHAVMQMLALAKRLRQVEAAALAGRAESESHRTDEDTFSYNWTRQSDIGSLWGRTVGILGLGEIGVELARRLRGWNCRVVYHRRRRLHPQVEEELGIQFSEREDILAASDFLVNLLPYSPETDRSLGSAAFARMKGGSCLVSCGSGSVIDEGALAEAIRSCHLAGAALDTFEWEPLQTDNPLLLLASGDPSLNVILTPHTAAGAPPKGSTFSRVEDYAPILQFLSGEPIADRVV